MLAFPLKLLSAVVACQHWRQRRSQRCGHGVHCAVSKHQGEAPVMDVATVLAVVLPSPAVVSSCNYSCNFFVVVVCLWGSCSPQLLLFFVIPLPAAVAGLLFVVSAGTGPVHCPAMVVLCLPVFPTCCRCLCAFFCCCQFRGSAVSLEQLAVFLSCVCPGVGPVWRVLWWWERGKRWTFGGRSRGTADRTRSAPKVPEAVVIGPCKAIMNGPRRLQAA